MDHVPSADQRSCLPQTPSVSQGIVLCALCLTGSTGFRRCAPFRDKRGWGFVATTLIGGRPWLET